MKFPQIENLVGRARRSERKTKEVKKNRQKKKNEKEEGNVINRLSFILFLCIILMCICSMYNIHIEIRVYRVYETHLFGRLIFCCLIFENKKKTCAILRIPTGNRIPFGFFFGLLVVSGANAFRRAVERWSSASCSFVGLWKCACENLVSGDPTRKRYATNTPYIAIRERTTANAMMMLALFSFY